MLYFKEMPIVSDALTSELEKERFANEVGFSYGDASYTIVLFHQLPDWFQDKLNNKYPELPFSPFQYVAIRG